MSALPSLPALPRPLPFVLPSAQAVAVPPRPPWLQTPAGGVAFYRRYTRELLLRYFRASMNIGRSPCILGHFVGRTRISRRRHSFEDMLVFVLDIETCLRQLDRLSQSVIAHLVLEDCTISQTASLLHQSDRNIHRAYAAAMDTLTALLLHKRLLSIPGTPVGRALSWPSPALLQTLSRGKPEIESNESTKQTT